MPRYKHGSGSVYKRGKAFWLSYYVKGERIRESADTTDRAEARRLLALKQGQIAEGRYQGPSADRVTFEDLAEMILTDYTNNGKKSLPDVEQKLRLHLRPYFGQKKAHEIASTDVEEYKLARLKEGAANAKINRELAALKRMFNLALQAEKIYRKPYIKMLEENNVRQGFFEQEEFDRVLSKLAPCLQAPLLFARLTGWRWPSEVLGIVWEQVDFEAGEVSLLVRTTKNKEARTFPLIVELQALLEQQWKLHCEQFPECPLVFPSDKGTRIVNYRKRWLKACQEAGVQRVPYDLRRTAVRDFDREGVPTVVAMRLTGHKTMSVHQRYNIVSQKDLKQAKRQLDEAFLRRTGTILGTKPEEETPSTLVH